MNKLIISISLFCFMYGCNEKPKAIAPFKDANTLGHNLTMSNTVSWAQIKGDTVRTGSVSPKRHFLIGYIATTEDGKIFDGGIDTAMDRYPNINSTAKWIYMRFETYKLHDLRILSITEMSERDHRAFWKGFVGPK